ncbi:MAG: hypothetical protein QOH21_2669 [Acidobacteriota bacterium]|nr:hypothetical protein [Acidobacteriota bacterium]
MPRIELRVALKALAGFLAGLALWVALSPLYDTFLAHSAQVVMRSFEKPPVTRLRPMLDDDRFISVDREDFDPRSKHPGIQLRDLTFNFILLTALFAIHPKAISDRNFIRFGLASLALCVTHVLATITEVMALYVMKLGPWSLVHYSDLSRNGWSLASTSYRVVLMYAIAFALWWIFRAPAVTPETAPVKKLSKKARGR